MEQYDYIICGAGCAGLSLAYRLCAPQYENKKILILERAPKNKDDRTWSFWVDRPHPFESIVHKRWTHINFYGDYDQHRMPISPYSYQTIKGIDFYNFTISAIEQSNHIDIRYETVSDLNEDDTGVEVRTQHNSYRADKVFSSIVSRFPEEDHLFVWQHFKGWVIRTKESCFDADTATFMDFRIPQQNETRFVYVLPYDEHNALVEATIFSKHIWEANEYDPIIESYINDYLPISSYELIEEEIGAIPMTTAQFNRDISKHIIPIGTLNDTVKPSSGYAFWRIQEESDVIVSGLLNDRVKRPRKKRKFIAYDKTLLDVVIREKQSAKKVFSLMFEHCKPQKIFKFLNEQTNVAEEAKIFIHLPIWSFLTSFISTNVLRRTK